MIRTGIEKPLYFKYMLMYHSNGEYHLLPVWTPITPDLSLTLISPWLKTIKIPYWVHEILTLLPNWYAMYAGFSLVMAYKDVSLFLVCWGIDRKSFMDIDSRKNNYSIIYPEMYPTESSCIQSFTLIPFIVYIWMELYFQ